MHLSCHAKSKNTENISLFVSCECNNITVQKVNSVRNGWDPCSNFCDPLKKHQWTVFHFALWAPCVLHTFNLMFSNWVILGWTFYKTVFNLQPGLLFPAARIWVGVNGKWLGHASQIQCAGHLPKNPWTSSLRLTYKKKKIYIYWVTAVSSYIFVGIGQKITSCSQ